MSAQAHPLFPLLSIPKLENPVMLRLLTSDFDLEPQYIREIEALPEGSRVGDLNRILEYTLEHNAELEHFWKLRNQDQSEPDARGVAALMHVLFFLSQSETPKNSIGLLLAATSPMNHEVFVQKQWRGALWQPFYLMGRHQLHGLQAVLGGGAQGGTEGGLVYRVAVAEALEQIALQDRSLREMAIDILFNALHFFCAGGPEDVPQEVVNPVLVALTHLQIDYANPLIEKAYRLKLYDPAVCGTPEEIEKRMQEPPAHFVIKEIQDLTDLYPRLAVAGSSAPFSGKAGEVLEMRSGRPERAYRKPTKQRTVKKVQPRTGPKVGRNDPCPCGSGKKYKKCHGR